MAKDKKKDRAHAKLEKVSRKRGETRKDAPAGRESGSADANGGQHHAAVAHGQPTQVDTTLPATRPELMTLHAAARARRNGAALESEAFRTAVTDLERIEIRIASIDRAADPPLG